VKRRTVQLRIERLVIRGQAPMNPATFRLAIAGELRRLIDGGSPVLLPGKGSKLASRTAAAIYQQLRGLGE
jgi:hypothetical protein